MRRRVPLPLQLRSKRHPVPTAFALLVAWTLPGAAQQAPQAAVELETLTLEAYPEWSRVTDTAISPDGRWMSYGYAPNEGDGTLHLAELDGTTVHAIERGSGPQFSADSRWVFYTVSSAGAGGTWQPRSGGWGATGGRPRAGRGRGRPHAPPHGSGVRHHLRSAGPAERRLLAG